MAGTIVRHKAQFQWSCSFFVFVLFESGEKSVNEANPLFFWSRTCYIIQKDVKKMEVQTKEQPAAWFADLVENNKRNSRKKRTNTRLYLTPVQHAWKQKIQFDKYIGTSTKSLLDVKARKNLFWNSRQVLQAVHKILTEWWSCAQHQEKTIVPGM